jgi:hypothetical protein
MNKNMTIYNTNQSSEFSHDTNNKTSRSLRLLAKVGIITLFLVAAIALPSLAAFSDSRQSKPSTKAQADRGSKSQEIDVVSIVKNRQFREGLNHVYTAPGGVRLSMRVAGGKIADWVVTDKNGKVIPSTYSAKTKMCRVCIKPEDGKEICFLVPCKNIIIKVPTTGTATKA